MNEKELLIKGASRLGVDLAPDEVIKLLKYKDITLETNKTLNLTSIIEDKEFIIKHFLDSFSLSQFFDFNRANSVLDLGTGAGIPGIPLKILYPETNFVLLDSLNKKINFIKEAVNNLGLKNIDCIHGRAEELGQNKEYREKFDIVISRAVAHLAVLSEYCLPFVKTDGLFLCLKGPKYQEEIKEARAAILKLGGSLEEIKTVKLPYSDVTHYILIIKKIKQSPTKYPRNPGKPTKNPIK